MTRVKNGRKGKVSKGERRSSNKTASMHTPAQRMLYKQAALIKGRDAYYTIENPNKNETNKRFIRMKVDGKLFVKRRQYAHKMPQEADV